LILLGLISNCQIEDEEEDEEGLLNRFAPGGGKGQGVLCSRQQPLGALADWPKRES
jgi:hypothetical protein